MCSFDKYLAKKRMRFLPDDTTSVLIKLMMKAMPMPDIVLEENNRYFIFAVIYISKYSSYQLINILVFLIKFYIAM